MKPLQWKAVDLLADGATQRKAAAECGVAAFTIRRWLNRREFKEALDRELKKLRDRNRDRLCREFEASVTQVATHKSAPFNFHASDEEETRVPRTIAHIFKIREQNQA